MREALRRNLLRSPLFSNALHDPSGVGVTRVEAQLRGKYGTRSGASTITSAISKLAAFVRPDRFVAWDHYATQGLNVVREVKKTHKYENYADYLDAFNEVLRGEEGRLIESVARTMDKDDYPLKNEERFLRRVLDVCLMKIGGRDV